MIPDEYVWLFWSLAFLIPWAILFAGFPRHRRAMLWASLFTAPYYIPALEHVITIAGPENCNGPANTC